MKALILNNEIVDLSTEGFPVSPEFVWVDCPEETTREWLYDGTSFSAPAYVPITLEELTSAVKQKLQEAIDVKAGTFGFSSGNALMLYAGKDNPFRTIADTFFVWEASVWYQAELYKQEIIAGTKPVITPEEAVALMPAYPV